MDDLISRKKLLNRTIYNPLHSPYITERDVLDCPSAQPTEASCWGCNCPKMERLKEQPITLLPRESAQPVEDIRVMCGECDAWNRYKNYPQPGWTPCTPETMPKNEEEVIVSILDDSGDNAFKYTASGWYAAAGDFWVVDNEINRRVVAWMPLPKPYTGKDGDHHED